MVLGESAASQAITPNGILSFFLHTIPELKSAHVSYTRSQGGSGIVWVEDDTPIGWPSIPSYLQKSLDTLEYSHCSMLVLGYGSMLSFFSSLFGSSSGCF